MTYLFYKRATYFVNIDLDDTYKWEEIEWRTWSCDMGGWSVKDKVAFVEKPTSIHAPPKMESSPQLTSSFICKVHFFP